MRCCAAPDATRTISRWRARRMPASCARPTRTPGSARSTPRPRRACPACSRFSTGKDVAADRLGNVPCLIPVPGLKEPPRPILALDTVRHVGDPLAMVIAETLAQAKDAAEQVEVDYEPLSAVTDARKGQLAFEIGHGRKQGQGRCSARQGRARHAARALQQPPGGEPDRAARRARRVRRGERPHHALHAEPGTAAPLRADRRRGAQDRARASCAWSPATSAARSA